MRRLKPVHIFVSPSFYQNLENERRNYAEQLSKKTGIYKPLTMTRYTEMITSKGKILFPSIKLSNAANVIKNSRKQKSRRI